MNYKLLAVTGMFLVWLIWPSMVVGQETSDVPQPEVAEPASKGGEVPVFSKPLLEDEIKAVEQTYKGQLETYRTAINRYQIAKQQYLQLETLTSLEEAVKATREAMVARNDVLITYMTLLRLNLIQATGVNLTQKDPTLAQLEASIQWLQGHQEQVKAASDRYKLLTVADAFTEREASVSSIAYKTLSLLAIGKLQTVYDKTVLLSEQVETDVVAAKADVKQEERKRALVEIQRELGEAQAAFAAINQNLEQERSEFSRSNYSTLQRGLGGIYSKLSQTLTHVSELVRL